MEITIEEIQKKFESLPEDLRWAIIEADVDNKIMEISKINGLNIEQSGQLSLETYMVMIGFTEPENFKESIRKSIGISDDKANTLVDEVNDKIMVNIRKYMMSKTEVTTSDNNPTSEEIDTNTKTPEETLKNLENEKELQEGPAPKNQPIFVQKLSISFKTPVKNTEYSLNNPSKREGTAPAKQEEAKPKTDPYREIPE